MKICIILIISLVLPVAAYAGGPTILASNKNAITIKSNGFGRTKALDMALAHCSQYGRVAVLISAAKQFGGRHVMSWSCE